MINRTQVMSGLWTIASGLILGSALLQVTPRSSPVALPTQLVTSSLMPRSSPVALPTQLVISPSMPNEEIGWTIVRAYIRTIAFAEGTWYPGRKDIDAYRTQALSYRQIPLSYAFKDHPYWTDRIIPCTGVGSERLCSACTGALQWHPDTYAAVRDRWKTAFWFEDGKFSPRNQDLAGIYKLQELGIWNILYSGIDWKQSKVTVSRTAFSKALSKSASTWASLPRYEGDGSGYHGQGARSIDKLYPFFLQQLRSQES